MVLSAVRYVIRFRCSVPRREDLENAENHCQVVRNTKLHGMKKSSHSTRGMRIAFILLANLLEATLSFSVQRPQSNKNGFSTKTGYNQILINPLEEQQSHHFRIVALHLSSSNVDYAEAEDVKSIKSLFSKYAGVSNSMTKDTLCKVPPFDEMLVSQKKEAEIPRNLENVRYLTLTCFVVSSYDLGSGRYIDGGVDGSMGCCNEEWRG